MANLIHLRHLSIFNGEREYEHKVNHNANTIEKITSEFIIKALSKMVMLEEINM